jgi:hypothetical protein
MLTLPTSGKGSSVGVDPQDFERMKAQERARLEVQREEKAARQRKTAKGCLTVIGVIVGLLVLLSFFRSDNRPTPETRSQAQRTADTSTPSAGRPSTAPAVPPLEIQSWRCGAESGYAKVEGEVKNVSAQPLRNVAAVATFRTKDGTFVKSEDSLIDYNPILPGQTSPFKVLTTHNPSITNCEVGFKHLFGGEIPSSIAPKRKGKKK